jgi:hypothetical protein
MARSIHLAPSFFPSQGSNILIQSGVYSGKEKAIWQLPSVALGSTLAHITSSQKKIKAEPAPEVFCTNF